MMQRTWSNVTADAFAVSTRSSGAEVDLTGTALSSASVDLAAVV
jgi:hypothetical protein